MLSIRGAKRSGRGSKLLRCGAETPSFDLRRKGSARIYLSCPGEGRDWAFRPTAVEFIPTLLYPALLHSTLLQLTLLMDTTREPCRISDPNLAHQNTYT